MLGAVAAVRATSASRTTLLEQHRDSRSTRSASATRGSARTGSARSSTRSAYAQLRALRRRARRTAARRCDAAGGSCVRTAVHRGYYVEPVLAEAPTVASAVEAGDVPADPDGCTAIAIATRRCASRTTPTWASPPASTASPTKCTLVPRRHRGRRHLRQPRAGRDHRRVARLPAVRRMERLGLDRQGDRVLLLPAALPARAVAHGRRVAMASSCRSREAIATHVADGAQRRARGLHAPDPVRRRPRAHPPGPARPAPVRMTPDLIYDQLIGMGCARKLTFSWGGNPGVGSLHRLRDAVEHDWPRAARARRAQPRRHGRGLSARARRGCRSALLRGYIGTDLVKHNPAHPPRRAAPITGEAIATVPALNPDVTILHAQRADRAGNVAIARHRRRAARSGARGDDADRHGRGNRRRAAAGDERHRAAALARHRGGALPGRRVSVLRARLLRARQRLLPALGRRSPATATRFSPGCERHVLDTRRPRGVPREPRRRPHERLHPRRDDDRRRRAAAAGRLRVLRRHRPAERGLQPRAPHACARTSC